ncbi:TetR/AcrR family transcriptional regulator [Falsibacillus albus]|uniref:TetR/AcrR family transcriptional regulator n=1 Tax=Falsibacillus albus TaxID=2478915 RepID=A0A3L7K742_9BACI|nr:TetR/AcrR family transcriptional regulator [Falsibacillus albus]RLQ98119.1 TetR/AcrR family transcriptional regulator [Falsibacillus albus]
MRKLEPEDKQKMRRIYAGKVLNAVRTKGFTPLTIQDLSTLMNISRASLYNYFSSKEDVVMELTYYCLSYIEEAGETILNEEIPYPIRLQKVFEQAVISAFYTSSIYMDDLKRNCMSLYNEKLHSRKKRLDVVQEFYLKGMDAGAFHRLNPSILIMQDEVVLEKMLNTAYLAREGLTLENALIDYYEAKSTQIVKSGLNYDHENGRIKEIADHILSKMAES